MFSKSTWGLFGFLILLVLRGCACQPEVQKEAVVEQEATEKGTSLEKAVEESFSEGGVEPSIEAESAEEGSVESEPSSQEVLWEADASEGVVERDLEKGPEFLAEQTLEKQPEPSVETKPLPLIQADLVKWVKDWDYSSDGANRFQAIAANEAASFVALIRAFLRADQAEVQRLAPLFGMVLSRLQDSVGGGSYWVLAEAMSPGVGRGLYLRPEQPVRNFVSQAPHPIKDTATHTQGAMLLRALQPQLLMIASLQRCDATQKTSCDGSTSQCNGAYRISDVAHFAESAFHLAHTVVAALQPAPLVLQLHGFAWNTGEPSAFVSNGTTHAAAQGTNSLRIRDALNTALQGTGLTATQSCNDPNDKDTRLCGTNNVQGRHTNGVMMVCTQSATQATHLFIHVEQRKELRTGTPGPSIMEKALRQLFP